MVYVVDFVNVSTVGLESSPVAEALAGLRANEARYFQSKYDHVFTVRPAAEAAEVVERLRRILETERGIVIASRPLEASSLEVDGIRWHMCSTSRAWRSTSCTAFRTAASAQSGSSSPRAWTSPTSWPAFKFARQRSKLAGTIRGSFFVIKGEYA